MICPRCHLPPTVGILHAGAPYGLGEPRWCVNRATEFSDPCGEDLVAAGLAPAPPPPEPPKVLERHVLARVLAYLKKRGARAWRNNVGSRETDHGKIPMGLGPGTADVVACYRGRWISVECKAPEGGRQTKLQKKHEAGVRAAGGLYVLARDVDDVKRALDHLDLVLNRREAEFAALRAGACVGEAGVRFYQERCAELEAEIEAMRAGL